MQHLKTVLTLARSAIAKPFDLSTIDSMITSVSGSSTFMTQIDLLYTRLIEERIAPGAARCESALLGCGC